MLHSKIIMENIDKDSVLWNHMSDEEKNMLIESSKNSHNIADDENDNGNYENTSFIETDIKASENILTEMNESDDELNGIDDMDSNWEEEFFKKFDWLDQSTIHNQNAMVEKTKYQLFLDCCKILENQFSITDEPDLAEDPYFNTLYMYFVSLEDEHLFLYTDFKKDYNDVMNTCLEKYDYVQLYKPQKVTFVMEINDFYDVDKYVKMFMHMFGVNNTRGGSYTDIILPDSSIEAIEREKEITTIDYYLRDKKNKA